MNFLQGQLIFQTNPKYDLIYEHLRDAYDIKYQHLFLLNVVFGHKYNRKVQFSGKGREIRSNFFKPDEQNVLYTILLADETINKDIEKFDEQDMQLPMRKTLEEYAEGGMEILIEELFLEKWDGSKIDKGYHDYNSDLLLFVIAKLEEVPF